jgi:hypothetical protein
MKNARIVDVHKACTMYGTDKMFKETDEKSQTFQG